MDWDNNVKRIQKKQRNDYKKKGPTEKGRQFTNLYVNDVVLVFNFIQATAKKSGNLQPNWTVAIIKGK